MASQDIDLHIRDIRKHIENSTRLANAACAGRERPILMYECLNHIMDAHTDEGHLNWTEAQQYFAARRVELIMFIQSENLHHAPMQHKKAAHQRYYNDDFEGSMILSDTDRAKLKDCNLCQDTGIGMAPRWQYTPCAFCAPHAFLRFHEKLAEHGLISKKRIFEKRSALKIEYDEANQSCDEQLILSHMDKIKMPDETIDALFDIYCRKDADSERMRSYRSPTKEEWAAFWDEEDRLEAKAQKAAANHSHCEGITP